MEIKKILTFLVVCLFVVLVIYTYSMRNEGMIVGPGYPPWYGGWYNGMYGPWGWYPRRYYGPRRWWWWR
jgi:hypothetical protein